MMLHSDNKMQLQKKKFTEHAEGKIDATLDYLFF